MASAERFKTLPYSFVEVRLAGDIYEYLQAIYKVEDADRRRKPMSVVQDRTVDWLGLETESGHVLLTVVDDLDWLDEQRHLLALQRKLNTYLSFVESGEVFAKLREQLGKDVSTDTPIKVGVLAKYKPTARGEAFFAHAKTNFVSAGLGLYFKLVVTPDA